MQNIGEIQTSVKGNWDHPHVENKWGISFLRYFWTFVNVEMGAKGIRGSAQEDTFAQICEYLEPLLSCSSSENGSSLQSFLQSVQYVMS